MTNNERGWIKLHRKILDWEWYNDPLVFKLFVHLLLTANHQDKKWFGNLINKGQLITSYPQLSIQLTGKQQAEIGVQRIRTAIGRLKSTGEITVRTTNKYSVITITNYSQYQENNSQTNSPASVQQQTTNRQLTTNKNDKKDNNEKKEGERERKISTTKFLEDKDIEEIANELSVSVKSVKWVYEKIKDYEVEKGKKYRDYKATLRNWIRRDIDEGKITVVDNSTKNKPTAFGMAMLEKWKREGGGNNV